MSEIYNLVTRPFTADNQSSVPDEAKKSGKYSDNNTIVHLAVPGIALYEEDFQDMWTPSNPNGLKGQTTAFSVLVDSIPSVGSFKYAQSAKRVSQSYAAVIYGANATGQEMSEQVKAMLEKMDTFLYEMKEDEPSPFATMTKGEFTRVKTAAYLRYEKLKEDIGEAADDIRRVAAAANRRADWQAGLSNSEITEIEADAVKKRRAINRALRMAENYWDEFSSEPNRRYRRLSREFSGDREIKWVEEALTYQATHGNELSASLIANAKELAKLGDWTPTGSSIPIKLAFPSSTKFANQSNKDGWTEISISSTDYQRLANSLKVNVDVGGGSSFGLWSLKADGGYEHSKDNSSIESDDMRITMEVSFVNI